MLISSIQYHNGQRENGWLLSTPRQRETVCKCGIGVVSGPGTVVGCILETLKGLSDRHVDMLMMEGYGLYADS